MQNKMSLTTPSNGDHIAAAIDRIEVSATFNDAALWLAVLPTDRERADGWADGIIHGSLTDHDPEGWLSSDFMDKARGVIGCEWLEVITGPEYIVIIDEHGKLSGSEPNTLATHVARDAGIALWDIIVGRAIVMPIRTLDAINAAYED